jgi:hypothetical protein
VLVSNDGGVQVPPATYAKRFYSFIESIVE